ncbi:GPI mannosyltransferase 2 [Nematocida homosporus]|uniref:GPI mannosyltransferase 2 n=1 Tax=Nematocida homosporus TaxID=1912981 RepID=UPI00221E3EF7|nr:GPI mannosyltransferase 2 [Nematocida homosporus]KAI5186260.1 GPI mannosyltransferase 2 [Nematocida homosporus]
MLLVPIKVWGVSRVVIMGLAGLSAWAVPHHDFSDRLLGDSGWGSFLLRWDGVYFWEIAKHGYIGERATAFFPLLPWLMQAVHWATGWELSTCGVVVSNVSGWLAAEALFRLSWRYFGAEKAKMALWLFAFNPCSVLYSALYTEALFAALCLWGILGILSNEYGWGSLGLMGAAATRSNGFLLGPLVLLNCWLKAAWMKGIGLAVSIGLVFGGIQGYWWWARFKSIGWTLPYSYIQDRHWDQGFLRFYRDTKNIPNLIVGLPFVMLSSLVLGLGVRREVKEIQKAKKKEGLKWRFYLTPFKATTLFLYALLLFQILLSIFFIHMNMHFRFVSFNPVIYWELADLFLSGSVLGQLLILGYVLFGFAYAVLYGAYFPPA